MRDKRGVIEHRGRGDPGIGSFQPPASSASCDHRFRPFEDQIARRRYDHESPHKSPQPINPLVLPVRQKRLLFQLGFRHEGDQPFPVAEMRQVSLCPAVALEEKRNDVRVEDDRLHAAGSVFVWLRHSRSAARKSSIRFFFRPKVAQKLLRVAWKRDALVSNQFLDCWMSLAHVLFGQRHR